jgi:Rrf2 family transcriptional regulator, iron-sulfur cluster assembly transcription factor
MITRSGTHALKAMAALASLPEGGYAGAAWIAGRIKAPANYLGKLLRQLSRAGLVEGRKGNGGGFRLARSMDSITLLEILDPIEHIMNARTCILGRAQCTHREPCALHKGWAVVRDEYLGFLRTTTLKEAAASAA